MIKSLLVKAICCIALIFSIAQGQDKHDSLFENSALEQLTGLLNLTPGDIRFRSDYTEIDEFRLAAVSELMSSPLGMISYCDEWKDVVDGKRFGSALKHAAKQSRLTRDDENFIYRMPDLDLSLSGKNTFFNSLEMNRLLVKIDNYLYNYFPSAIDSAFAKLTPEQGRFILNEYKETILEDTSIYSLPVETIDSISEIEEEYIEEFVAFAGKIDKRHMIEAGVAGAIDIYNEINRFISDLKAENISYKRIYADTTVIPNRVNRDYYIGKNKKWKIGGTGSDTYRGDYDFIFDLGGDDYYDLTYNSDKPHSVIIIDLSGDDIYNSGDDFAYGAGCLSIGLLYDMAGNDSYTGANFSLGSGYFGVGVLYDGGGSDRYSGDTYTQGVGSFGIGMLYDNSGHDEYSGRLFSQGVGMTEGVGVIVENAGNDNYFAGGKYPEGLGLAGDDTHFQSLSQGFAYGLRPYMSGGIGAIFDMAGKDNYVTDIYGQGASYWWALGMIYDASGYDQYVSHQYAQGTGVHMSLGLLLDETGNDFYRGKGLMQGVGHDYACGIILDRNGDDIYQASDLSQAAGSANGIGVLIDNRGSDAYYVIGKKKTHGYGNPRRDFGSIGLFLDLSGMDNYLGYGSDNDIWKTDSKWGGGIDWEFIVNDTTKTDEAE